MQDYLIYHYVTVPIIFLEWQVTVGVGTSYYYKCYIVQPLNPFGLAIQYARYPYTCSYARA